MKSNRPSTQLNHNIRHIPSLYWLSVGVLFWLFGFLLIPTFDYSTCSLCDAHQYQKLFQYFNTDEWEAIKFPYYLRPAIPFIAALLPGQDAKLGFELINAVFAILGVWGIYGLWSYCKLSHTLMIIGFGWLIFHWVGLVRYNVADYINVDVPLYLIYALTLLLFFRQKYTWFYLLTPFAILVKESFEIIISMLIVFQIIKEKKLTKNSIHLLLSLGIGMLLQQWWIWSLPTTYEKESSVMTLLYYIKITLLEPTRLVRWLAAIGSAFGVFPVILLVRWRSIWYQNNDMRLLMILSVTFLGLGLIAGGDMTRIIYLGLPFVMTLSLVQWEKEKTGKLYLVILLSIPFLRPFSWNIQQIHPVEYAPMTEVWIWAGYYVVSIAMTHFALLNPSKIPLFGRYEEK